MQDIINWIIANKDELITGFLGLIFVSSVIVKLTPSTKDDSVVNTILRILDLFSLAKTDMDKKLIEEAKKRVGK